MITRFLIALLLFEAAVMGLVYSAREVLDLRSAAHWQMAYYAEKFENEKCGAKHNTLLKQIKKEGLWTRLGLPGQPWLL